MGAPLILTEETNRRSWTETQLAAIKSIRKALERAAGDCNRLGVTSMFHSLCLMCDRCTDAIGYLEERQLRTMRRPAVLFAERSPLGGDA